MARLLSHTADAVQAVRAGQSLNDVLQRCPAEARPGAQALTFAVLRRLGSALAVRALLAPKKPPPPVEALLLTGIALLWPGDAAPYAEHTLVDQAVAAARARQAASGGFVNAVLRSFLRERARLTGAVLADPVAAHNHPAWWIDRLRRDWPGQAEAILAADNQRAPMTLRVNRRHGATADYLQRLAVQGLAGRVVGPQAIELAEPCPVGELPGFAQGDASVQDAAAQWAAPWLLGLDDPRLVPLPPGARVLDACAAPGGKTAHLLELADLDVTALDRDAQRLGRVHQNLDRLGLRARVLAADAGEPGDGTAAAVGWWDGRPYDAILLDAPCSASGIVRRHPDVRWLRRDSDIGALAATQARLLDALWPLLAPGGRLLYCTCSVFKAEGQDQIDAFLQRQSQARWLPHPLRPGHNLPLHDNSGTAGPPPDGASADGFFYALLAKPD